MEASCAAVAPALEALASASVNCLFRETRALTAAVSASVLAAADAVKAAIAASSALVLIGGLSAVHSAVFRVSVLSILERECRLVIGPYSILPGRASACSLLHTGNASPETRVSGQRTYRSSAASDKPSACCTVHNDGSTRCCHPRPTGRIDAASLNHLSAVCK